VRFNLGGEPEAEQLGEREPDFGLAVAVGHVDVDLHRRLMADNALDHRCDLRRGACLELAAHAQGPSSRTLLFGAR
jgi:hypothetical protein